VYPPGVPYQCARRGGGGRALLLDGSQTGTLANEIHQIVAVEQPVHTDVVLERLKELNHVGRAGSNVRTNFDRGIQVAVKRGFIRKDEESFFGQTWKTLLHFVFLALASQ
jgi:hypothetical protein